MSKKANFIRIFSNTLPIRWELSWKAQRSHGFYSTDIWNTPLGW